MSHAFPHIVILGGGTSGWMAANMLANHFKETSIRLTLIESSNIPTVGVGEGSTPFFKQFFEQLGVAEQEWMPACHATYKTGIEFPGWCGESGPESYFHPFYSEIDNEQVPVFFAACEARKKGYTAYAHPDDFFVTSHLRGQHKAPVGAPYAQADYGYHFDAGLLAVFLRELAVKRGVTWIDDTVSDVSMHASGDIAALVTQKHGAIDADLFIDCTGFKGVLIKGALERTFLSLRDRLLCDAAVAFPVERTDEHIPSTTRSEAVEAGWVWSIPLSHRTGSGLVYSREHYSSQEATAQLAAYHGLAPEALENAKHLAWEPGRLHQHWHKNCFAIGLSQGFLEPLEAPMLNITQQTIAMMIEQIDALEKSPNTGQLKATMAHLKSGFNVQVNNMIDGTCDYIQAHYLLNKRSDSAFWQDACRNPHRSDALNDILLSWNNGQTLDAALAQHGQTQVYLKTSWYCLFAGLNAFPAATTVMPQHSAQIVYAATQRAQELASEFPDHAKTLASYYQKDSFKEYSIA